MLNFEYGKVLKEHGVTVAVGALVLSASGVAVTAMVRAARKNHPRLESPAGPAPDLSIFDTATDGLLPRVAAGVIVADEPSVEALAERLEQDQEQIAAVLGELVDRHVVELVEADDETRYHVTPAMAVAVQDAAIDERRHPGLVAAVYELEPATDNL